MLFVYLPKKQGASLYFLQRILPALRQLSHLNIQVKNMISIARPTEEVREDSNLEIINTNSVDEEESNENLHRRLFVSSYEDRQSLRRKYTQLIGLVEGIVL